MEDDIFTLWGMVVRNHSIEDFRSKLISAEFGIKSLEDRLYMILDHFDTQTINQDQEGESILFNIFQSLTSLDIVNSSCRDLQKSINDVINEDERNSPP